MGTSEAIRKRELTMTVVCVCGHQFGAWRVRCDACGTPAPRKESFNPPKVVRRERERRPNECIFCHQRKAKDRCPSCNEMIHKNCIGVHVDDCRKFVAERDALLQEAATK